MIVVVGELVVVDYDGRSLLLPRPHLIRQLSVGLLVERIDLDIRPAQILEVSAAVVQEGGGEGAPHRARPALTEAVKNDGRDLTALTHAGAVPHEEAAAGAVGALVHVSLSLREGAELRGG